MTLDIISLPEWFFHRQYQRLKTGGNRLLKKVKRKTFSKGKGSRNTPLFNP
jgi:hypothetical protein